MSHMDSSQVACPRCPTTWSAGLFSAVDADTIQIQVDAILDGSFERMTCRGCGHTFRPEHALLFVSHARRLWIVMQPRSDRPGFAGLERGVERRVMTNMARFAPAGIESLQGIRLRLVFGQHMLTEAVRMSYAGLDPRLLECAKLLAIRRNLAALMQHGPFELCFERLDGAMPICAVHTLPAGDRVAELALGDDVLADVEASLPALQERFPALFDRPYMSATRYLIADIV
jgi:hypothetical protein